MMKMKKILLMLIFIAPFFGMGQGGPKVDVIKFRDKVSSTERDAFDVPTGEIWMIWNTTTEQLEYAKSDDVWLVVNSNNEITPQLTIKDDGVGNEDSGIGFKSSSGTTRLSMGYSGPTSTAYIINATSGTTLNIPDAGDPSFNEILRADGFKFTGGGSSTEILLSNGLHADLIDDDTFATATSSNIPSAESVKAYVDANSSPTPIYDDGVLFTTTPTQLNFKGAGVSLSSPVSNQVDITISGASGDLSSTDIDTYGELNTLVADVTLTHNGLFDTFGELNAIVADATLVDTNDAQTLTNKTIDADNNTISNIGSAEITNESITSSDIQNGTIGADDIATNAVSTNKIDDMAVTNAKVMDNTILEPKLNITNAPTDNHILSYNAAGTNFTWISPSFEVADIGAADKTLTSSDVHKFNYTDDTVIFTLDNGLSVGDELTFAVTDIDSIITVIPDTGVDIIGNGTSPIDGAFQIDSLNIGKVKKLASNLYYAMGYIKPYTTTLLVPSLENINTKAYIDAKEFSGSTNGASVSPTDQSGNGTTFTSTDITKQTDADGDPTFALNGTSSRISLGNNFNFTTGVAQSIGIFVSADGMGTGARFSKRDDASGGSNDHFAVYNNYYYMGANEGNPSFSATTNVLLTLTKTTGDVWYIYENGTQRATGAWTNETSAVDLLIGAQVNGGGFNDYCTGEFEVFFITDDFITNTEAGTIATEISTR